MFLPAKSTIAHQRKILEIKKPVEVLRWTWNYSFLSKNLNSISWSSPLNLKYSTNKQCKGDSSTATGKMPREAQVFWNSCK
jgi:hypothetical protein